MACRGTALLCHIFVNCLTCSFFPTVLLKYYLHGLIRVNAGIVVCCKIAYGFSISHLYLHNHSTIRHCVTHSLKTVSFKHPTEMYGNNVSKQRWIRWTAFIMHKWNEKFIQNFSQNLKRKEHLRGIGIQVTIILKLTVKPLTWGCELYLSSSG